jgi:hypothetical protein
VIAMEAPIGFVTLFEAVDAVGRILIGEAWQYAICLDDPDAEKENAPHERVITVIAEGCEGGRIAAAYRTITGVHKLDLAVWRSPSWRRYFERGEIDLDLPLLDENWRPHKSFTARCPCEIFVRRDSLECFIVSIEPASKPAARRGGRPPEFEWVEIKMLFEQLLQNRGDPTNEKDQSPGWRSIADAIKVISAHLEKQGNAVPEKTRLREVLNAVLSDYRRALADASAN